MPLPIDWRDRAQRYALDGHPDAALSYAAIAAVDELRTLNLLLAAHTLSDGDAAEEARRRLGIDRNRDSAEDGRG